mmetsp:Transcript_5625/g.7844  ORF Transcript_5625/g.7844 Transcript_5625/m.7844 type:complete len:407 (-) Transcript_5625:122-1342(-)|eukprot:CAMPEP_0194048240 /NCGR_PEP_ID=MMETSP0009_2-20130614/26805_1 /TAXON_ID=210454 /ORGANISM="Grammatophora oceanica, Strain CCMP 410" /LENGTH=406 /DNA_ID=CAMNT_0038694061 /DNA_START=89 /DNA_END=1309 /DNA_ORIENTATION=-
MPRPRGRRNYNRVAGDEDAKQEGKKGKSDAKKNKETTDDETVSLDPKTAATDEIDDEENRISITILDPAQSKFKLSVNPEWTIGKVKEIGHNVHKVEASAQRLIYRGKMLSDETTLKEAGISKEKTIVHLFPKPKVVVQGDEEATENSSSNDEESGAHIPRIVLDPDEAEMRSSILVLGSAEVMEAQNNVKLLAFLLLIVCSMELLALFSIMLNPDVDDGSSSPETDDQQPPPGPSDDIMPGTDPEMRHWRNSDYFDLALSTFGFYVATLGIKATTENTRSLARRYMICTAIVGVFWNCFYFYLNVMMEKDIEAKRLAKQDDDYILPPTPESDTYIKAFLGIVIPMMVWVLCCVRAWQFHHLIAEAEEEAEERIRTELDLEEGDSSSGGVEQQQEQELPVQGATLT